MTSFFYVTVLKNFLHDFSVMYTCKNCSITTEILKKKTFLPLGGNKVCFEGNFKHVAQPKFLGSFQKSLIYVERNLCAKN